MKELKGLADDVLQSSNCPLAIDLANAVISHIDGLLQNAIEESFYDQD